MDTIDVPDVALDGEDRTAARHRRRWPVIVALCVVAAGAGLVGFRAWLTQEPHEVTVSEAVKKYQSSTTPTTPTTGPRSGPTPGVYVYATTGQEYVDALGGDTHVYPSTTTMTVTTSSCGFTFAWTPVEGRSDVTDLCMSGGGIAQTHAVNEHSFFHLSQSEAFTCADGAWWVPPAGTTTWTAVCRSSERTTGRTATLVGTEPLLIGGTEHDAVHVHFDDVVTGASSGTSATDLWLDPATGLLLREVAMAATGNDTMVGHVTFHETFDLTLVSTTPQT